ncbi:MAG: tripartite tricarboxylate transporter substrate binding protein [Betaproteobacteria bacterium]|nr:tripartite tricarboxylate transporter substrate binding protein [Betaproteobacteria bacterium]
MKIRAFVLAFCAFSFSGTSAQERYPSRPLRIVVPFAPGGSTDIFARLVAERLAAAIAQPVVVENRAGASGNIGADAVAKSAPDGHTLLMATTGVMAINNALFKGMAYDAAKDFGPVIFIASITNVLAVPDGLPAKNVAELVALAKKEPGKLTFASSGGGSSTHLSAELFKSMAGIDAAHIPFKGSGQALIDVVAGRVSMIFDNMPSALPHIKGGKLRALGVTGLKRSPALPEVPTISEAGVAGYDSLSWSGFAVPAGTPRDIVLRLNRETAAILSTADMKQKLAEQGADAVGGPPEAFAEHVRREREKWGRLVRERNIAVN